jgi:phosphorylcholine metabolism protein LicD
MLFLDKLSNWAIYCGMPAVTVYHMVCSNAFLNVAADDAKGLEKAANICLAPVQYLLDGKVAVSSQGHYHLEPRFNYGDFTYQIAALSALSLPFTLPVGAALKGMSFFSQETRMRHVKILAAQNSRKVEPKIDYYRSLGIPIELDPEPLQIQQYQRRPGDENCLKAEKALLGAIAALFKENQIPFWVDCGTCIGAYRYGGAIPWDEDIDVAVLLPDFENVIHALNGLDKDKYDVQDWSNRCRPKTYIRVYIRENRNYIDIYHFQIDPEKRQVKYLLSNEICNFLVESWKIRERRFTVASAYETVFPLKKANFDGIEVFVPNKTKLYLQERYGQDIRPSKVYNEISMEYEKDLSHPYWQLPHVH